MILLDVGMVGVDHHHLGGAARGAARLDGAGGAVADLQEAHQARRLAAAGQLLAFAAQPGEVGAGAGAVFEQARLAHPQIHDPALVDEIVVDRLDEAGVRLRMLVGRLRLADLAGLEVDVIVTLARAVDAIGPVQAGVEPLRRIGRRHLHGEHVAQLVEEGACVRLGIEIAALPAPIGPGAGEPVEHLLGRGLADHALALGQLGKRGFVGHRAPQPGRNGGLLEFLQPGGDAGLAEIFLRQHVGGDLRPGRRHLDRVEPEHHRAVRIADLAGGQAELDLRIRRLAVLGEAPLDSHVMPLVGYGSRERPPIPDPRADLPRSASLPASPALSLTPLLLAPAPPQLRDRCGTTVRPPSRQHEAGPPVPMRAARVAYRRFQGAPGGTSDHSRRTKES